MYIRFIISITLRKIFVKTVLENHSSKNIFNGKNCLIRKELNTIKYYISFRLFDGVQENTEYSIVHIQKILKFRLTYWLIKLYWVNFSFASKWEVYYTTVPTANAERWNLFKNLSVIKWTTLRTSLISFPIVEYMNFLRLMFFYHRHYYFQYLWAHR